MGYSKLLGFFLAHAIRAEIIITAETINRWRAHRLTAAAQTAFAAQASALRWPDADFSNIPSAPGLLRVRRAADSGDDLWSVFNVLRKT
jgi:hypothetical protein